MTSFFDQVYRYLNFILVANAKNITIFKVNKSDLDSIFKLHQPFIQP